MADTPAKTIKQFDLERFVQAVQSFAGRVEKSDDPAIVAAAKQLQGELKRVKIKS